MRILAVDTATEVCGVAVMVNGQVAAQLIEAQGATHARVLMQTIRLALDMANLDLQALDGFVVTQGPGSFTGLRIGISTVKGLAAAMARPLVGVSTLAVLAHQASPDGPCVCPMIDARRHEVYWSVYHRGNNAWSMKAAERVGSVEEAMASLDRACLFIGNGAQLYAPTIRRLARNAVFFVDAELNTIRPSVLAQLGQKRLEQGEFDALHSFTPVYLRKSDAVPTKKQRAQGQSIAGCEGGDRGNRLLS